MRRSSIVLFLVLIVVAGVSWYSWNTLRSTSSASSIPDTPIGTGITSVQELSNRTRTYDTAWSDVIKQKTEMAQTSPFVFKELAFAQSFVGDLRSAESSLDQYCQSYPQDGSCRKLEYVFDVETTKDNEGTVLSDVKFEILGKPNTQKTLDQKTLTEKEAASDITYKNTIVRAKIMKKGYTDFVTQTSHIVWDDDATTTKEVTIKPIMIPADVKVTKNISEGFEVKTKNYTFTVQPNSFVYADGAAVQGDVEVYFFDITADTREVYSSGLLNMNLFESGTMRNLGEGMITYGMPLVKAYQGDNELYVKKPIIGVGRMSDLESFKERNGLQTIDFASVPKNTPLDFAGATRYKLPPFWQYMKRTGTWVTSTFEVLDNTGLARFSFSDF